MAIALSTELPEALTDLRTRALFVLRLEVRSPQLVGPTPETYRRVGVISGGSFAGERLSGQVLEGGNDWQTVRRDGATTLDVRIVLRTDDDALIGMTYGGLRHGPADVLKRLDSGEVVDPSSYYFRVNPLFETSATKYDWINRIIAIGIGHRFVDGPVYNILE